MPLLTYMFIYLFIYFTHQRMYSDACMHTRRYEQLIHRHRNDKASRKIKVMCSLFQKDNHAFVPLLFP